MEEINFWTGLERALTHIEQQLQTPDVEATLATLKFAKRFLAAVSFEIDTGQQPINHLGQTAVFVFRVESKT